MSGNLTRDEHGEFYTTAPALIEALKAVPYGTRLYKNQIGNLSAVDVETDEYIGFIDIHPAEYVACPQPQQWRA